MPSVGEPLERRKILFVDDERSMLAGLRRMLRPYRADWELLFAPSGQMALQLMTEETDVIVVDMVMPDMDGAELLDRVRDEYPACVRVVLSGQADLKASVRAAAVAHTYISKPCSPDEIIDTVKRSCQLHQWLSDPKLRTTLGSVDALPSAPSTCHEINRALALPEVSPIEIADLVAKDPAMTAKVLQLVNSSFFGFPHKMKSARDAVAYLGLDLLSSLVTNVAVFRQFKPRTRILGFSVDALQERSMALNRIIRSIAVEYPELEADASLAGLLCDVGQLALAAHAPGDLAAALAHAKKEGIDPNASAEELGLVPHAAVGAYMLALWGFPDCIVEAVAYHFCPQRFGGDQLRAADIVYIASQIERGSTDWDDAYLTRLGLTDAVESWAQLAAEV